MERRLAAVLSADVVGYSRLMEADEAGTLEALKTHRAEFIDPTIAAHHGRIVKVMGDGLLAEFSSVVDAVACAVDLQKGITERNAGEPENRRLAFRIGVNLGDIIVEDDDVYGGGVNVAARLQALAEPGGICISGTAFDHVEGKLDCGYAFLGAKHVKNITKPVPAYRVLTDPDAVGKVIGVRGPGAPLGRWAVAAALLLAVAVAGLAAWLRPWEPTIETASVERMALPLPDKPSLAVLPFNNMSNDPEQEYFADGMTEDLITDLSRISGLFVIARNSTFAYKGQPVKVSEVAEELGVRYVLEGSVRRAGNQVRINAQLIDAMSGGHVWADRYDQELDDIFEVQDAITAKVVEALELHLTDMEKERGDEGPETTSVEAYDLVLRARELMTRFDHDAANKARDLLERAIEIDPAYAEAYGLLGLYYFDEWRVWGRNPDQNLSQALEFAKTAVELSPSEPAAHVLLALIYQWRREFDAANAEADRALALKPGDAITLGNLGSMLVYAGRGEEAATVIKQAIRLNPFHPPNYLEWLGNAYWLLGKYVQCVEAAKRGVALDPDYVSLHVVLAVCYGELGKEEDAQAAAAEIRRINPRFTLQAYASYVPYTEDHDRQRRVALLRKAGVPE